MLLLGDLIKRLNPIIAYYIKHYTLKQILSIAQSNCKIENY